ncbi:MAG: methylmalonyl Co-A mutase-associated GTPase MeaB [Solirubrobacterales bacterium]|mgnify:CR=1 FL=1|nr:methylmalonyl Co-A mutase-associated GTPase MeaB [Solirubrobacterales bacterium]HMT05887.1 methylmalonyl Co-A mutase-associated GTPase MeaB [Solirubrobacterales bacterium]
MRTRQSLAELKEGITAGDRGALSRAITLAESRRADDQEHAQELIADLLPETGKAIRVGITGVPGAGKSTTIEELGLQLIEKGHKVAVLVVDPTSARTGGSILGDKTRMNRLSSEAEAFIRPSPSGGVLGGVARKTREAMLLCEAAGFDVIIIESVGVGQSEAELAEMVDCLMLLLVPGAGDELQGIKRGIMELADVIVVNKADGDRIPMAKRARGDYRHALRMLPPSTPGWETPVLIASATERTGLVDVWNTVEAHRSLLEESGLLHERRRRQTERWLDSMIEEAVLAAVHGRPGVEKAIADARRDVDVGKITVPQATQLVVEAAGLAGEGKK